MPLGPEDITLTGKTLTGGALSGVALGTPASGTLTNCTSLPSASINTGNLSIGTGGVLTAGTIELGDASNTTIGRPGAGRLTVEGVELLRPAVQADQETATSNILGVTPGTQQYHPSAAKAWSVVTVSAGTHSQQTSYNMTSITDGATGICTYTIATDFSSTNWNCQATGEGAGTTVAQARGTSTSSKAAGSVVMACYDWAATSALQDPTSASMIGFGDQ